MNRRAALTIVASSLVLLLLGAFAWRWLGGFGDANLGTAEEEPLLGARPEASTEVRLYFPGSDEKLHVEMAQVPQESTEKRVRGIVEFLLAGPQSRRLWPVFPEGVELAGVYLGAGQVAYVDLHGRDGGPPPSSGSSQETLEIYSLVNSVVLNVPEVESLVLLWNGNQPLSFAGHVDTSLPLAAWPSLVAEEP